MSAMLGIAATACGSRSSLPVCPSGLYDTHKKECVFSNGTVDGAVIDGDSDGSPSDGSSNTRMQCHSNADCMEPAPLCGPLGACITCITDADCTAHAGQPLCDPTTSMCVPCQSDQQCVAKLGPNPGICMSHQDGRCATDAETIYVQNSNKCSSTSGTVAAPYCDLGTAVNALSPARAVIVVRGTVRGGVAIDRPYLVSVIGQQSAAAYSTGVPVVHVSETDLYVRGLGIGDCDDVGILADLGSIVRLDGVQISGNHKGGLNMMGAGYDIINSLIVGNGDPNTLSGGGAYLTKPAAGMPARFAFNTVVQNISYGVVCTDQTQRIDASLLARQAQYSTGPSYGYDYLKCNLEATSRALGAADPGLVVNTYRITTTSPCFDWIKTPPSDAPTHDIDGNRRPQEEGYDCGASEHVP